MPEKKRIEKFKTKDDFDESAYVQDKIKEARDFFHKSLDEAYNNDNKVFKTISIFSLIDCLAQEYANYPSRDTAKAFCAFVLKFQDKYDYLDKVEPVTLFYDYEDNIEKIIRYPELIDIEPSLCKPELEISLSKLRLRDETPVKKVIDSSFLDELLKIIERDKGDKIANRYSNQHTLIRLLYKMRSKAVHELSHIGGETKWERADGFNEPFYRDLTRLYVDEGYIVRDKVYELVIPSKFLYDLAQNVIDNYLKHCVDTQSLPFKNNNKYKRKVMITWND